MGCCEQELWRFESRNSDRAGKTHIIRRIGAFGMRRRLHLTTSCLVLLLGLPSAKGQGLIAPTAGPINSAMAGASVAAPVEFGSTYWNPANLSGLERNQFLLGTQ